jgi:hypothetical protein
MHCDEDTHLGLLAEELPLTSAGVTDTGHIYLFDRDILNLIRAAAKQKMEAILRGGTR